MIFKILKGCGYVARDQWMIISWLLGNRDKDYGVIDFERNHCFQPVATEHMDLWFSKLVDMLLVINSDPY